jgi:predicted enzyme related to lactoylglutathione lyase
MSEATPAPGRFVWADLMTTDLEAAKRFYFGLFPTWKDDPVEIGPAAGNYHRFSLEGRGAGGMIALDGSHSVVSHWVPYATVTSVDEACARAVALGGKVRVPAADIPNVGRSALLADAQGALLSPIALREEPPEQSGPMAVGAFCWHELLTPDAAAATAFYTALLGWSHAALPMGEALYHLFRRGEKDAAGMLQMPPGAKGPPTWLVYMYTPDLEASVAKLKELGGTLHMGPRAMPGVGQLAVVADPTGAMFSLFRSERG